MSDTPRLDAVLDKMLIDVEPVRRSPTGTVEVVTRALTSIAATLERELAEAKAELRSVRELYMRENAELAKALTIAERALEIAEARR